MDVQKDIRGSERDTKPGDIEFANGVIIRMMVGIAFIRIQNFHFFIRGVLFLPDLLDLLGGEFIRLKECVEVLLVYFPVKLLGKHTY